MIQPRNLIVVEENAHVQIIERHQSLTNNAVLTNAVTEVFAAKRATVDFIKFRMIRKCFLVDNTYVDQKTKVLFLYIHFLLEEILLEII